MAKLCTRFICLTLLLSPTFANEPELIKLLESPDTPPAAKDEAFQKLKLTASAKSVSALAAFLPDPALSHSARYALESIDAPEAAAALRDALPKTTGLTKAGIIESLGQRRDRQSADALKELVRDPDEHVAAAAIVALGRIGGAEAVGALRAVRSTGPKSLTPLVLDAMLACADSIAAGGFRHDAGRIYREIHNAGDAPEAARTAAYRGLILAAASADAAADPEESAMSLVEKALTGEDRAALLACLPLVREMQTIPPAAVAALLPKLKPEIRVALIECLSQRGDAAAASAIVALAADDHQPTPVRIAAFEALGHLGDASVVPLLASTAAAEPAPQQQAARQALALLNAPGVRDAIIEKIDASEPPVRIELIRALGRRHERAAAARLLALTGDEEPAVRDAALQSLAAVADDSMIPPLVRNTARAPSDERRAPIERALRTVAARAIDADRAARSIAVGLAVADPAAAPALLRALAVVDSPPALAALRDHTRSADPALASAAVDALASSSNPAAATDLLAIVKDSSRAEEQRILAFRGLVRLADTDALQPQARIALLKASLAAAPRTEEKRLALSALGRIATAESLRAIQPLLKDPAIAEEAALASLQVARALIVTHPQDARAACETILATAPTEKLAAEARALLEKIAGK